MSVTLNDISAAFGVSVIVLWVGAACFLAGMYFGGGEILKYTGMAVLAVGATAFTLSAGVGMRMMRKERNEYRNHP